jgi:hypothetical protein
MKTALQTAAIVALSIAAHVAVRLLIGWHR